MYVAYPDLIKILKIHKVIRCKQGPGYYPLTCRTSSVSLLLLDGVELLVAAAAAAAALLACFFFARSAWALVK